MRKQQRGTIVCERQDRLGRREVTFTEQRRKVRRFVPHDKETELSKKRIRSWHEALEQVWEDYNYCRLPEVKAMNIIRKYELKIEHAELALRGAF